MPAKEASEPREITSAPTLAGLTVGLSAAVALWYALHSLYLGISLTRPIPFGDEWTFVYGDLVPYLDGRYPIGNLFGQANEHRILTTRLVLFGDAIWFQMQGLFPTLVMYAALAGIAAMLSYLAVEPETLAVHLAAFAIALALTWSTSQFLVFSYHYEVGFPLLHLFALASLFAFALAVTQGGRARYGWLAATLIADFFAVWSQGSGLFLTVCFVLLCLWLRTANRIAALFFAGHALILAHFFAGYRLATHHQLPEPTRFVDALLKFLAWPFRTWWQEAMPVIGAIGLAILVIVAAAVTLRALTRRADRNLCVLVAFAAFIAIEGALLSYTRPEGPSFRHANMAIMFPAATLAALWRWFSLSPLPALRWAALALIMLTIVASNRDYEQHWRRHAGYLTETMQSFRAGSYPPGLQKRFKWLPDALARLKEARLGPFAE